MVKGNFLFLNFFPKTKLTPLRNQKSLKRLGYATPLMEHKDHYYFTHRDTDPNPEPCGSCPDFHILYLWKSILILYSHLCLGLTSILSSIHICYVKFCMHFSSLTYMLHAALILLGLITLIIFGEEYKL
jgi:hypothetical protein